MAKLIVQFSGGKDSLASLLWVRNNMSKNFTTVFCDTAGELEKRAKSAEREIRNILDDIER